MSNNELHEKLKAYQELKELLSEVKDELDNIESEIKDHMGEQEEIKVMGITVKWTKYTTSRFDSKVFQVEHKAMYDQYIKNTQARRFQVVV